MLGDNDHRRAIHKSARNASNRQCHHLHHLVQLCAKEAMNPDTAGCHQQGTEDGFGNRGQEARIDRELVPLVQEMGGDHAIDQAAQDR